MNAPRAWLGQWVATTAVAALAATAADAVLLQRSRSYFTGGFLSADHITSTLETLLFLAGSLTADACVLGPAAALALWMASWLARPGFLCVILAAGLALLPVAVADFVNYEIGAFLGDAFDFQLMLDLAGGSPREILAVAWAHLAPVAWVVGAAVLLAAASVAVLRRRGPRSAPGVRPPLKEAVAGSALIVAGGVIVVASLRAGSDVLDNGLRRKPTGKLLGNVATVLSDVDRDGFGLLGRPGDPDLFDGRVRPYAVDVPGNGIDEDGVGGDLPAGEPAYTEPAAPARPWTATPDVVLVALESFRADALGAVVNGRPVTPVLDALVSRGVSVGTAYSHNGYTVQSRRHLFSGSLADLRGPATLIDDFTAQGYETAYFSGQDESFGGREMGVGFDRADVRYDARMDRAHRYSTFTTAGSLAVPSEVVVKRVSEFLRTRQRTRPLFLYVNFHDTHFPYHHRAIRPLLDTPVLAQADIVPTRADALREMYLNTAANVDRAVGAVLLEARQVLGRDPAVVVVADHGESLFDEGFLGHGYALNDAQTRIPLIVAGLPVSITEPVGQADLRDLIADGLSAGGVGPTVRRDPGRMVFQYLGSIHRPAQIGFAGLDTRFTYDFRSRAVRAGRSPWRRVEDLSAEEAATCLKLVRTWERMMIARHEVKAAGPGGPG